ncbi:acetylxylan esterase [Aquisalimonas sp. 2447]|uniref:acetylxylan esterase n=1 Tax=Aquisalimonas sp. 2447 TaxID=2740807 RepID=UPI0014325497|nr:acetylxylan esterase [Aquisalimonas sp. 2447]QIT56141.1 acetylxylan esterase [Aquisalimonas sp. 2447]
MEEEFAGNVDMDRVGASGHSQGGGGAIMAGRDERVTATAPMQPYTIGLGHRSSSQSEQHGPMFLMSGSSDAIAGTTLNQGPVFRNTNVPVFWGILQGAGHFEPTGSAGDFRGPSTAWMRYYLMDDGDAAAWFFGSDCVLCESSDWDVDTRDIN